MSVTGKLLSVFRVDQQLQGLESRLRGAEKFHDEQSKQLESIRSQQRTLTTQLKQLLAQIGEQEVEIKSIDERITRLRDLMNNAKTNKEYQAILVEVNTIKADRDRIEQGALEQMARADELKKQQADLDSKAGERDRVRSVAATDRDRKADEIRDRVNELRAERARLAAEVPADSLAVYQELLSKRGDEAMAPAEVQDRKRHEATCGSCMMSIPVETVSALMQGSRLMRCVSCGCILYMEREVAESLQPAQSKR